MQMKTSVLILAAAALSVAQQPAARQAPQFTSDGRLVYPADYREWVYLSSGLGMSYAREAASADPSFDNVFVSRPAWESFLRNGTWPNGTVLVLEVRASRSRVSINQTGRVQDQLEAVEVEVKEQDRFPGKWAFFGFGEQTSPVKAIPATASCYSCHAQNGAVDNTFVQFYPTLLAVAKQKNTVRPDAEH